MTRRFQVYRVGDSYNTSVGYHRGSETGGGGFESRYQPRFLRFVRYSLTSSYFLTTILEFIRQKFRVFWSVEFFSQKLPPFRRNWNKWLVYNFFSNFDKNFSIFRKKPKKVYKLQVCQSLLKFNYKINLSYKFFQFFCISFLSPLSSGKKHFFRNNVCSIKSFCDIDLEIMPVRLVSIEFSWF